MYFEMRRLGSALSEVLEESYRKNYIRMPLQVGGFEGKVVADKLLDYMAEG